MQLHAKPGQAAKQCPARKAASSPKVAGAVRSARKVVSAVAFKDSPAPALPSIKKETVVDKFKSFMASEVRLKGAIASSEATCLAPSLFGACCCEVLLSRLITTATLSPVAACCLLT